ncbi:MAG: PA2169 family four-helix-bundle protein [Pseudomonas sp.]
MTDKTAHTLNDLIQIARDGQDFYNEAASKVKDAELSSLFTRIAASKADIIASLGAAVSAAGGKPAEHGTFVGSVQQLYGRLRASLGDTTYGFVAELEESEDRLLGGFRDALGDTDTSPLARQEIQRLLPEVQQTHAVMRDRKHALKNAS